MTGKPAHVRDRDRACRLAPDDPAEALAIARKIEAPWYRAQALAYAARFAERHRVLAIAQEACAAADRGEDDYQRAAARAWPLCALIERGLEARAREELEVALELARRSSPIGSRAEALVLLMEASYALGRSVRLELVDEVASLDHSGAHWRVRRAHERALSLLAHDDLDEATRRAEVDDPARARRLRSAALERAREPRSLFW
ncbi:MAG: hypothetical protein AAF957_20210 [Planctomycetota bacterium]